ncbi:MULTISPECIES: sugar phosphate nucleotidyltransferase [Serratia]|uniref:sugar phosphate nucleotidyltransferase n=1 Tax=Serratia TaxID=613 RepID=UPI00041F064F|nr:MULTISPECIES: NDP-sugar synthase [Serratia]MBE0151829.1 NDP-sugar synthase [Serratia fonticola]MBL5903470.1 NDP-sugar synthase [Serratia fonticola]OKP24163.1 mannose-1-phosphate guanyltransferase [Serratia fonticola]CAI2107955.1 Glucose-1-phosphate adenylyltransferase [Serratia fonticola]
MKAMILAAGKGTRARPLTTILPKPMIPLIRKPIMESIVEHLREYGFNQLMVNTSYLSADIENYFRDGHAWGVEMGYSYEGVMEGNTFVDNVLGSAGGMKHIQNFSGFFDDTFVVVCGDALIDVDFDQVLAFHRARKSVATLIMRPVPADQVSKYGIVVTNDQGRVSQFQEKPKAEEALSNNANTGIYVFEPEIFNYIPDGVEYDIGSQLFPKLAELDVPFYGIVLPFQWVDIGSLQDFWHVNRMILNRELPDYPMPGIQVAPQIWCGLNVKADFANLDIEGPVYIGSSTEIQPGVTIRGPAIIGAGCLLEQGAMVDQSFVADYTRVGGIAQLYQQMIFAGKVISPDGTAIDLSDAGLNWLIDDKRRTDIITAEKSLFKELLTKDTFL